MRKLIIILLGAYGLLAISNSYAIDLKRAKVTQVVNDVQVISGVNQSEKKAELNDVLAMPDILRTGAASRAELVAEDETVTRVGANTIFSFNPASRTIDLKQGSLLFHSPHGKGGGSIHTGSATASVLGSTLIATATPNGGFKVISLEDGVDIKLPNGLHQHLKPGQMTFVLPGGNQLAPIVYFRMDDLASHSLLVKGFQQPLPSLQLILNEMGKQNRLIKLGRLLDTGLRAGNNAGPDKIEVLDADTLKYAINSQNVQKALAADATINQPSLTDSTIPTPPARVFVTPQISLTGNSFYAGKIFQGFAARNIFFNTLASPAGVNVDLSPYAVLSKFDFVAAQNIDFQGSVTFQGFSGNQLSLVAGNDLTFAPNITLKANVGDFEFSSPNALTMDGVTLVNTVGDIGVTSGDAINLNNINIEKQGQLTLTAPNLIHLTWTSGGNNGLPSGSSLVTDAATGQVFLDSQSGPLSVTGTSIQAHYLTLNSGDSILLDASGRTLTATGAGASASFTAPVLITVKNADFSSFGAVNMVANTITLNGVAFAADSIDNFGTYTGHVNVNGTQIPGGLNFYNSSYGGTAITSPSQIIISSRPGSTPGIYSYATGCPCGH